MTVKELKEKLNNYKDDMLVSIEYPRNITESMNTCFVDCDEEDFFVHEDVLILYGEKSFE